MVSMATWAKPFLGWEKINTLLKVEGAE